MDKELFNDLISQGVALMAAANYEAAKEKFALALAQDERSTEAYLHLGNACANLQEYDEAIDAFKKALIVEPNNGEAMFSIGNAYLLKDDLVSAVEYYNGAEANGYATSAMYQIMAGVFYESKDSVQALRNITKAIALEPFDGELRLFKARIYLAEDQYEAALETLDEFQQILPDAFEVYSLKSQIYVGLGRKHEALEICNEGVKRFPKDANLALTKFKVLVELGMDDEASIFLNGMRSQGLYERVLKDAVTQEVVLLLRKNDVDGATAALEKANEKLGGDADLLYLMLTIFGKTGNHEKTLDLSEKLQKKEPNDYYLASALYFHAFALENLGKIDAAKEEYKALTKRIRKITIADPSLYEGYIFRLLGHAKIGEYEKAFELADYLENMYPERVDCHAFRYYIYKEQGDKDGMEREKACVKQIDPNMVL